MKDPSHWYIYDYLDTVYDTDLRRYPAGTTLVQWVEQEGFKDVSSLIVEHIRNIHVGDAVLRDPVLKHKATSQLALLDEGTHQAGMEGIQWALFAARKKEHVTFRSEINVKMFLGQKK